MNKFEKVSKYNDVDLPLPVRATAGSAGYDFVAAEDAVIPPYESIMTALGSQTSLFPYTLSEISDLTKREDCRPTLVSTGMKCHLDDGYYLKLVSRSSMPFKHWILLANGEGTIDSDYYNNPDNEGEIYFQFINFSPFPIQI